jgi:aspartate racemase
MQKTSIAILGLGSRSTAFYLEELNRIYNLKKGGYSTCPFLLMNVDFDSINSLLPTPSIELANVLQNYINQIQKLDTTHILIPNITLHESIDMINVSKTVIHPIHLSILKIKENNWSKVVLFGSLHSMQANYIRSYFEAENIEVIIPEQNDMTTIDEVRRAVYNGIENETLIDNYHEIIDKYTQHHPVILGCTELSIIKPKLINHNLLDMANVQIEHVVALQISKSTD